MHRACYSTGKEIGAVIHTHAPALTAIGLLDIDLGEVLPEVKHSLSEITRVPHAPAGSEGLADSVGAAVANGAGLVLLERHGAVTVGRDLSEACDRMELGELSSKAVLMARGEAGGR
jgi:L-fuculose-phosphate aldolase